MYIIVYKTFILFPDITVLSRVFAFTDESYGKRQTEVKRKMVVVWPICDSCFENRYQHANRNRKQQRYNNNNNNNNKNNNNSQLTKQQQP